MSDLRHFSESDLPWFLDNELTAEETRHLEVCAECREAMARFRSIDNDLLRWGKSTDARPRRRLIPWVAAAAIAAGLVAAILEPRYQPAHVASPFVPIPYIAPLDPRENATIVRMDIRVAVLNSVGYRILGDPNATVRADVLVGEDGRAHAIRLNDIDLIGD
jgi:hypothetical protein